jgi:hypothetical protein
MTRTHSTTEAPCPICTEGRVTVYWEHGGGYFNPITGSAEAPWSSPEDQEATCTCRLWLEALQTTGAITEEIVQALLGRYDQACEEGGA